MATPNLAKAGTVKPGVLASAQLPNGWTHLITVGAGQAVQIVQGVISNNSGATVAVSLAIAQTGQDPVDGTHTIIDGFALNAGDALSLADYLASAWLGEGDQLAVGVDVDASATIVLTGLTVTG